MTLEATIRFAVLLLLGCGPDTEAYVDERAAAQCAVFARCDQLGDLGFSDEAECQAALVADGVYACRDTFDPQASRACVRALNEASCDAIEAGEADFTPCIDACVDEFPSIW